MHDEQTQMGNDRKDFDILDPLFQEQADDRWFSSFAELPNIDEARRSGDLDTALRLVTAGLESAKASAGTLSHQLSGWWNDSSGIGERSVKRSNATTERLFRDAGISEGMVALELGCGPGEVTELIANIVGPSGLVLAVDRSKEMLASARARLEGSGAENVRFVCADLAGAPDYLSDVEHSSVDVVTGRRVLMYLAEPERVLAGLLPWLRRGGLAVFEEADSTMVPGRTAPMPAHEQAAAWLEEMLKEEDVDRSMGFHLPATLIKAGLQLERIRAEAVIEGQGEQYTLAELLQLLAPRLESAGVATTSAIESLAARIDGERDPSHVFISGMRFCAQARKQ